MSRGTLFHTISHKHPTKTQNSLYVPANPHRLIRVFYERSVQSLEPSAYATSENSSACVDTQVDLSLRLAHKYNCRNSRGSVHFGIITIYFHNKRNHYCLKVIVQKTLCINKTETSLSGIFPQSYLMD